MVVSARPRRVGSTLANQTTLRADPFPMPRSKVLEDMAWAELGMSTKPKQRRGGWRSSVLVPVVVCVALYANWRTLTMVLAPVNECSRVQFRAARC